VRNLANEDLQQAVTEYETLRAQLESLNQQSEMLRLSLEEHMRAKETMIRFQKGGKDAEILVPVGANSFLFAKIEDPDKAIMGIGSDITVEESMEGAVKRLETRIEDIEKALQGLAGRMVETSQMVEEKSELVKDLYSKTQQEIE